MKQAYRLFSFLIYSNVFVAGCALLMTWQTYHIVMPVPLHEGYAFFVVFATLCSYNFHWYLTTASAIPSERVRWTINNRQVIIAFFLVGFIGSISTGYKYFLKGDHWPWFIIAIGMTFLYSAPKIPHPLFRLLRKVALGKTIFLSFVWTYVTAVLPIIIEGSEWNGDAILFVSARFFLVYGICILFDYRDREDDRIAGIKSFITYLDRKGISLLFTSSLLVFAICTVFLLKYDASLLQIAILLVPGIIVAGLFPVATKNFSDMLYYFVLDGLMALSALIMLITGI